MTETPKPIEPQDIRPGDRICVAWSMSGIDRTCTLTVAEVDLVSMLVKSVDGSGWLTLDAGGNATITLIDRPTPDRPVGSHWRDPETGAEYVFRDDGDYSRYRTGRHRPGDACLVTGLDDEIARLVPVPALDPAVLWPRAERFAPPCREDCDRTPEYCQRQRGHNGPHACYKSDGTVWFVWGDPR